MIGDQKSFFFDTPQQKQPDSKTTPEALTAGLNPPQAEAVLYGDGPILVLAGAGSGKTRVLTHRVAHLVANRGVSADRILAVTFTNKASEEMRHRLHALLGDDAHTLWISTFHSAGLKILRHNAVRLSYTNQFVIYDDQDSKSALKGVIKELDIDDEKYPVDMFSRKIDSFKNELVSPTEAAKRTFDIASELVAQVYDRYQKVLLAADAMDFGDLLVNAVRVLEEFPDVLAYYRRHLHYILVDEFQDTNLVQYRFIRLLAEPRRNIFVVGDDDQSIYGFRGATIRNILEFERDFPNTHVVKLEQNYRSTGTILEAAHSVIEKNATRKPKKLWTSGDMGQPIRTFIGYDENMEADFIASEIQRLHTQGFKHSQIAILYRTNAQTRALEEALVKRRIPYRIFGGLKFFDRKEVKDILGYLRLISNPADNQAFQRIVNTPPRGIGAQSLVAVAEEAKRSSQPFLQAAITVAESNKSIRGFVELIAELKRESESKPLGQFLSFVIQRTEYGPRLAAMKDPTVQSRLENLQELEALARSMENNELSPRDVMKEFLDKISLTSSADLPTSKTDNSKGGKNGEQPDTISLMTLHLAKGLEFPVVFLGGIEEGLLPHYLSIDDPKGIEEERRLCYVGITRAMKILYMTRAYQRGMFSSRGSAGSSGGARIVSRFARDIADERLIAVGTERSQGATFMDGFPHFSYDEGGYDSPFSEGLNRGWSKERRASTSRAFNTTQTKSSVSLEQIKKLLAPADSLHDEESAKNSQAIAQEYAAKPTAALEQLGAGTEVIHVSFGKGVVERVTGTGTSAMVIVKFDSFEEPKKLVYRFAKLALVSSP
jgi:DNA helicase-2/ATP-dependent DNA helicase PcrA